MNDEELESLLRAADESAGPPASTSPDLAARVRNGYARRRQRTVRVKFAVVLAGFYVAGMATMWTVFALAATGTADLAQHTSDTSNSAAPSTAVPPLRSREHDVQKQDNRQSIRPEFVAEKTRYGLLRQMGDESQRRGDLQAAVAYYGQALDVATVVERKISCDEDNWLLVSLKKDRFALRISATDGDSI